MPDTAPEWAVPDWAQTAPPDWATAAPPAAVFTPRPAGNTVSTLSGGTRQAIAPGPTDLADLGSEFLGELRAVPDRLKQGLELAQTGLENVGATALNVAAELPRNLTGETAPSRARFGADQPDPGLFQPGQGIWPSDANAQQPEGSRFNQLVRGLTTPGNLLAAPFAALKPVQIYFGAQTTAGAMDSAARVLDGDLPAADRRAAAQDFLLNAGMAGGIAAHLVSEATPVKIRALANAISAGEPIGHLLPGQPAGEPAPEWARPDAQTAPDWVRNGNVSARPPTGPEPRPPVPLSEPVRAVSPTVAPPTPPVAAPAPAAPAASPAPEPTGAEEDGLKPGLPALLPVDVTPAQIRAMRAGGNEAPPDVLDDIGDYTGRPVQFTGPDYGQTIADARQATYTASGRPSAATARLDKLISPEAGEPADRVLAALAAANGKYADWTPDDLANAIVSAHARRESAGAGDDAAARQLAEQAARDDLWQKANRGSRPGAGAMPVEHLFAGDTFTVAGQRMTVPLDEHEAFPKDADTGQLAGVMVEGAYGWQHLPAGTKIHLDKGSLMGTEETGPVGAPKSTGPLTAVAEALTNKLESLKIAHDPTRMSLGLPAAAWNTMLDMVKLGVRAGKPLLVAMDAAIARFKRLNPSVDFNEADVRDQLHRQLATPQDKLIAPQPVASPHRQTAGALTGIKVAAMDEQRLMRGEEPLAQLAARSFSGTTWPDALSRIEADPAAPQKLVAELKAAQDAGHGRALTDHDVALLLYHEADLSYQRARLTREAEQAAADPTHPAHSHPALQLERARIADDLDAAEQVIQQARSETGRGLAALRNTLQDNWTLAAMEFSRRAANGGRPLTDAEHAELADLRAKIDASNKALETARAAEAEERSKRMAQDAIDARIEAIKNGPGYDRAPDSIYDRLSKALQAEAPAAMSRLKNLFKPTAGIVPKSPLADLAIVGAAYIDKGLRTFTDWSKAIVRDLGEDVIPLLNKAWEKANERVNNAADRLAKGRHSIEAKKRVRKDDVPGDRAQIVEGLKKQVADAKADAAAPDAPDALTGDYIRRLMENFIRSGLREREPLVDALHKVLTEDVGLDITRRETREAMSNYGRYKALNPDEIKAQRRDLSHQIAQTLKLEDIQAKRPLPRSGIEHHTPSTAGRALLQQVNEAKRRFGVVVSDPARQLKSALDARKTWLRNRISDLQYQLTAGSRSVKTKTATVWDAETKLLELQRDELSKQLDALAPKPGLTDAQRAQIAQRGIERTIKQLNDKIAKGDVATPARRAAPVSPALDALKTQRDALRAQWHELRALDPAYKASEETRQMKALLARLESHRAELVARTARGDFAPAPKRVPGAWHSSPDVVRAKAANAAAKLAFEDGQRRARLAARTRPQKLADAAVQWSRNAKLLSWHVYPKLVLAALTRVVADPVGRVLATPLHLVPGLAEKAPYEIPALNLGKNLHAEAANLAGILTAGPEAWRKLRTGRSELDTLSGRSLQRDPEMMSFIGASHGMVKEPIRRGAFQHSLEVRTAAMVRAGLDPTDPLHQTALISSAVADANRRIFMQDNIISTAFHRLTINYLKGQGEKGVFGARGLANTLEFLFPIVKVPTNLGIYSTQLATGLPEAIARLTKAAYQGQLANRAEKLPPEDAGAIARAFKLGLAGTLLAAYAWQNADKFGGTWDEERKKSAPLKAGQIATPLGNLPAWLNHTPEGMFLNTVASARRNYDRYVKKNPDARMEAALSAAAFCVLTPIKNMPFADTWLRLFGDRHDPGKLLGAMARDAILPQAVTQIQTALDPVKRSPGGFTDELKLALPGLRQTVPAAKRQNL